MICVTGHNEVTRVIYDPEICSYTDLLKLHWESHDPTQARRSNMMKSRLKS